MTAIYKIADAIAEHSPIRLDSLAEMFPELTLEQVGKAASNASTRGLCHCARVVTAADGRRLGIWVSGPKEAKPEPLPRGDFGIRRVASVWELGAMNDTSSRRTA